MEILEREEGVLHSTHPVPPKFREATSQLIEGIVSFEDAKISRRTFIGAAAAGAVLAATKGKSQEGDSGEGGSDKGGSDKK